MKVFAQPSAEESHLSKDETNEVWHEAKSERPYGVQLSLDDWREAERLALKKKLDDNS